MRLDKRGRRIGYNWWRSLIMDHWFAADHEWWCRREDEASGYETEMEEFKERYPRPTLKSFMIGLKHTRPEE